MAVESKTGLLTHVGVAIVWGLIVMVMIYTVGRISGAHMNPAVSIAFAAVGRMPAFDAAAYVITQCAGALTGAAAIAGVMGVDDVKLGSTMTELAPLAAVAVEFMMTAILMFVVMGVSTGERRIDHCGLGGRRHHRDGSIRGRSANQGIDEPSTQSWTRSGVGVYREPLDLHRRTDRRCTVRGLSVLADAERRGDAGGGYLRAVAKQQPALGKQSPPRVQAEPASDSAAESLTLSVCCSESFSSRSKTPLTKRWLFLSP